MISEFPIGEEAEEPESSARASSDAPIEPLENQKESVEENSTHERISDAQPPQREPKKKGRPKKEPEPQ